MTCAFGDTRCLARASGSNDASRPHLSGARAASWSGASGASASFAAERDEGTGEQRQSRDDHGLVDGAPPLERSPVAEGRRPVGQHHVGWPKSSRTQSHRFLCQVPPDGTAPSIDGVSEGGVSVPLAGKCERRRQRPHRSALYFVVGRSSPPRITSGVRSRTPARARRSPRRLARTVPTRQVAAGPVLLPRSGRAPAPSARWAPRCPCEPGRVLQRARRRPVSSAASSSAPQRRRCDGRRSRHRGHQ